MAKSWFHHENCTTEQAEELTRQYQSRNIKTTKQLSPDYKSWCVSALLSESKYAPKPSRLWQNKMWG